MNKELIKQYKAEFDYWLNGGKLLARRWISDPNDGDYSYTIWYEIGQEGWDIDKIFNYSLEYDKVQIVIDDKYVEFRKALAEGKTVQYDVSCNINKAWENLSLAHKFSGPTSNYRIKPEEPQFKVGDLVELLYTNNPKLIGVIEKLDISQAFIEWGNGRSWKSFDKLAFWQPKEDEWVCSIKDTDSFEVYKYKSHPNPKPCQPFLGTLPFNLKD